MVTQRTHIAPGRGNQIVDVDGFDFTVAEWTVKFCQVLGDLYRERRRSLTNELVWGRRLLKIRDRMGGPNAQAWRAFLSDLEAGVDRRRLWLLMRVAVVVDDRGELVAEKCEAMAKGLLADGASSPKARAAAQRVLRAASLGNTPSMDDVRRCVRFGDSQIENAQTGEAGGADSGERRKGGGRPPSGRALGLAATRDGWAHETTADAVGSARQAKTAVPAAQVRAESWPAAGAHGAATLDQGARTHGLNRGRDDRDAAGAVPHAGGAGVAAVAGDRATGGAGLLPRGRRQDAVGQLSLYQMHDACKRELDATGQAIGLVRMAAGKLDDHRDAEASRLMQERLDFERNWRERWLRNLNNTSSGGGRGGS